MGGDGRRHLGCASLPDNQKWAKRRDVGGAGCWNHARLARQCWNSGNPPVTQVATPLIMQNFKAWYNLNGWVIKKFTSLTVVMKDKMSYIDQNHFLNQAVNMFFSAVNLGILTWGVYGIDSLLQPASSGQLTNYSLSHFCVGFKRESGRLPFGATPKINMLLFNFLCLIVLKEVLRLVIRIALGLVYFQPLTYALSRHTFIFLPSEKHCRAGPTLTTEQTQSWWTRQQFFFW